MPPPSADTTPAAIGRLRDAIDAQLRDCVERERHGARSRYWRVRLARIDLVAPRAPDALRALEADVHRHRRRFPWDFPFTDLGSARLLAASVDGLALTLRDLRLQCEGWRPPRRKRGLWKRFQARRSA